jgi:hypothetical protein
MIEGETFNKGDYVFAEYREQIVSDYRDNPLIESLPSIMSKEEVVRKLAIYPRIGEVERNLEVVIREHLLQTLFRAFQPLSMHIMLESILSRTLRQGYINRNPLIRQANLEYLKGYERINNTSQNYVDRANTYTNGGIALIGESGMGKTTTVERIMNLYPPCIVHRNYKGEQFNQHQIVFMKVECPFDGSVKGLCHQIIMEIDSLIGTNYYNKTSGLAVNRLIPTLEQIFRNINLGMLVVDEIQNLSSAKTGAHNMLNFLVSIMNMEIPVLSIGTNKAHAIFQSEFRLSRRNSGQGDIFFSKIKGANSFDWIALCNMLRHYRILKNEYEDFDAISNCLYEYSQGIIDIAVKLYVSSQIEAMNDSTENLTPTTIAKVASKDYSLVEPMITALRDDNIFVLNRYDDLMPLKSDYYNNRLGNLVKTQADEKFHIDGGIGRVLNTKQDFENELTVKYSKNKLDRKKIIPEELSKDDIRRVVSEGKLTGLSEYESLSKIGYIKSLDAISGG